MALLFIYHFYGYRRISIESDRSYLRNKFREIGPRFPVSKRSDFTSDVSPECLIKTSGRQTISSAIALSPFPPSHTLSGNFTTRQLFYVFTTVRLTLSTHNCTYT